MLISLAIDASQISLDENELKKLSIGLKKSERVYRWISQKDLSIPLLSLGTVEDRELLHLNEKIKSILELHQSFNLKLNGVWAYPNQNAGRLLWIGVQNSVALRGLQEDLARSLIPAKDYREDKIFKPILAIARFKNHHDVSDLISPYKGHDFGKLKVEKLNLLHLISGGAFPQHQVVGEFELGKSVAKSLDIH